MRKQSNQTRLRREAPSLSSAAPANARAGGPASAQGPRAPGDRRPSAEPCRGSPLLLQGVEDLLPVHQLLGDHPGDADHREAPVVELLVPQALELFGVAPQSERVEVQVVAGLLVGFVRPPLAGLEGVVVVEEREHLWDGDAEDDSRPEVPLQPDLRPRLDGGAVEAAVEEDGVLLGHNEAQGREHGDPAVLELGLAEEAEPALRDGVRIRPLLGVADGVKEAQRRGDAGHAL
mmetsp:Transcript_116849/g.331089  ORF Transcript_116849/g.331089 Transcript_116849/m.331089 type:complete len:233 (-) Transcript_116849:68-766(-)